MIKKIITSIFITGFLFVALAFSPGNAQAQPPVPTDFTVGTVTTSTVSFTWTPPGGGTDSYSLCWLWGSTPPSSPNAVGYHLVSGGSENSYTVTGLQSGQQISFALFSRASGTYSTTGATASATTLSITTTTFTNEQPYSLIIGQRIPEGDCNSNDGGFSAHSFAYPYDVFSLASATGGEGKFFVADTYNNRVLIYNTTPTSNNQDADLVLGQANFTSVSSGSAANQMYNPSGVWSDGTKLYVVDQGNNRILVWNTIPTSNQVSADYVLGQSAFGAGHTAANNGGRNASTLSLTDGVYANGITTRDLGYAIQLIVCDGANNRVLIWDDVSGNTVYNGKPADHVIGQANFTTANHPTQNGNNSTAATLYYPVDVAVTSTGKLVILSLNENRALIYNSIPSTNGVSANLVLGQTNFTTNVQHSSSTATSFFAPKCLSVSRYSDKLAIATSGYRILIWNTFPTSSNASADNVLAFPDLTSDSQTQFSNEYQDGQNASTIRHCYGMSWTSMGNLMIADGSRNSVVEYKGGDDYLRAPTNISATNITSNSADISWSGSSAADYVALIKVGSSPALAYNDTSNVEVLNVPGATSNSFTPLVCGTTYTITIFSQAIIGGNYAYSPTGISTTFTTSSAATCINAPMTNGNVRQMLTSPTGDTIFAVGGFTRVYSKSGTVYYRKHMFAFSPVTGNVFDWGTDSDAEISGICRDPNTGKFFIDGGFNSVHGTAKKYLASLNSDGSLITGFNPPNFNNLVGVNSATSMTLNLTGDTLYFVGSFDFYTDADNNSIARRNMAAVLASDGSITDFNTPAYYVSGGSCRLFKLSPDGRSLYCGSNTGGQYLNVVSLATGTTDAAFDFQPNAFVTSTWYDGSKYIYFAGSFTSFMGNSNIGRVAKVDISGPVPVLVATFNNTASSHPDQIVRSIYGTSTTLYIAGNFNNLGTTARRNIAALNISDGSLTSFDPAYPNVISIGTGGNIFLSPINGTLYTNWEQGVSNFSFLQAYGIPVPPSNIDGSSSNNVGTSSSVNFSNSGGLFASLTTSASNLGNTTVTVSGANGDTTIVNGFTVMERIVTITPTTQPSDNVTVHIFATKAEMDFFSSIHPTFGNSGNNYSGCKVHRLGAGNTYVQTFVPTITINGEVVDIAFSTPGFSSFVMSDDGLLPVELAAFTSAANKNIVTLNWKTVSELNNSGFDIESKKATTTSWSKVGNVQGKGTSNVENLYKFEQRNVATGKYNYRLKQIDFNGNYQYYDLLNSVEVGVPAKWDLSQNYPNPFNPTTKINFDIPKESFVKINVYDMVGRLVSTIVNEKKDAGYFTVEFNASSLASSVYFYRIETEAFTLTKKMMVIK